MPPRSYKQFCALARALDVIGDRWSLLVVRNLLLGPQTWSQLRANLPGLASNLLSSRLEQLQGDDIINKSDGGYGLTPRGESLEKPLFAIAAWGEANVFDQPREGEVLRVRYLFTSLRRKLKAAPEAAGGVLAISIDDEAYYLQWGPHATLAQGTPSADVDATWTTSFDGLRALLFTAEDAATLAARADGFTGDRRLLERLRALVRP